MSSNTSPQHAQSFAATKAARTPAAWLLLSLATSCFGLFSQTCMASNPEPFAVPAIQEWTGGEGDLPIPTADIVVDQKSAAQLQPIAQLFQQDLERLNLGRRAIVLGGVPASGVHITLSLGELPVIEKHPAVAAEAYSIEIGNSVNIKGSTPAGVYYGTRTILQILAQNPSAPMLPKGKIFDYPQLRQRMLMLDVGRKVFPYEVLLDYVQMMGWFKMNELHLHLSDEGFGGTYTGFRVESTTYPGLASKDCAYTKEQLRALQAAAHLRGITVTPEIDMPGHARVFTDYWPDLRNPKLSRDYLDVTNPATIERMKKLLDEMIPIFSAPDFHIGTDEYAVGGSAEDKAMFHESFRQFINTMNAYVRSKGKNCRIWSGYEHMPGKTQIDPSVIIDMWETNDARAEIEQGHPVINSDQGRTYIVPGAHYYGVSNSGLYNGWEPWKFSGDPSKNPTPDDPHFLGGKLHVWNDQGPTGYTMTEIANLTEPSLMAISEKLWGRKGSKDYVEFEKRSAPLKTVPGVTVYDRISGRPADGLVLSLPGEHTLNASSAEPLAYSGKPRANLEYPWTLTVQIQRTADTGDREVLLSSDLAEICTGFTRTEEQKVKDPATGAEKKQKITKHGIGLIRAAGIPGEDPSKARAANDVSRVYADTPPLNQWTTLTIVGSKGHTTLYVNGKAAGEQNEQMVCPLATLGSKTGHSFAGKVKDLAIYDRALSAKEIGRMAGLDVPDNLAAGKPVTASASDTAYGLTPDKVTDEDLHSRWSSGVTRADQWLSIDLGAVKEINTVNIHWESAFPADYHVLVSQDGSTWSDVTSGAGCAGATEAKFKTVPARYVKIAMSKPTTGWGYSIFEVEVLKRKE